MFRAEKKAAARASFSAEEEQCRTGSFLSDRLEKPSESVSRSVMNQRPGSQESLPHQPGQAFLPSLFALRRNNETMVVGFSTESTDFHEAPP